jgi:hypothetical protein
MGQVDVQAQQAVTMLHPQGTLHAFGEMRSDDGKVLASGDLIQYVRGTTVTTRALFQFKDGSVDDETTVFTQGRTLRLVSDHRVQKGPFFAHPTEMTIDAKSGQVTVRSTGKDGKEEVYTEHMKLPADISNGMVPVVIENMRPDATGETVSMIVATPKPRLVKLAISNAGADPFSVVGSQRKATRYDIKIELGGIAGVVAPIIGKQPADIQLWIVPGDAPTFMRERGQTIADGPILTIQLVSPVWPQEQKAGE